jgi:uncharacterized DUF497 family protein
MDFRWNEWNLEHAQRHGVTAAEAEWVVRTAGRPFPIRARDGRWLVMGPTEGGRPVQVSYLVDGEGPIYIIHARPLEDSEKRRYRRRIGR